MSSHVVEEVEGPEEMPSSLITSLNSKETKPKISQKKKKVPRKNQKPQQIKKKPKNKFDLSSLVKKSSKPSKVCLDENKTLLDVVNTIPVMSVRLEQLYGNSCFDKRTTLGSFIAKLPQSKKRLLNFISSNKQKKVIGVKKMTLV